MLSRRLVAEARANDKVKLLIVDVDGFREMAPKLAFGSICVFVDLPDSERETVEKIGEPYYFRWFNPPGLAPNQVCVVKSRYEEAVNSYHTHQAYVVEAAKLTEGDVIELGAGDGSTDALHDLLKDTDRVLYTVDNSLEWLSKFSTRLASPKHIFVLDDDPARVLKQLSVAKRWGMVFVDHSPGNTRGNAIKTARDCADYIVVHDTEETGYLLEPLLCEFKYRRDFRQRRPWTTVVSNTKPIFDDPCGVE